MWEYVVGVFVVLATLVCSLLYGLVRLLSAMTRSVGSAGPTSSQLSEEKHDTHALFRHLPQLKHAIAWRALGKFPTPIHKCTMTSPEGETVTFSVKREDLCSPFYGGNKVRTLQHSLAVCESRFEKAGSKTPVLVIGSGGSNQVVASMIHGARMNLKFAPVWGKDEPDFDNTLNILSALSLGPVHSNYVWGTYKGGLQAFRAVLATLRSKDCIVTATGGNTPAGVLGQISGCLELADQIVSGEIEDVDGIYLPIGSSCTISGLILGVALARALNLKAFRKPGFKIVGVVVHHAFGLLQRLTKIHHKAARIPLSIRHTIRHAARLLQELGGPYLEGGAIHILENYVTVVAEKDVVGLYGTHSAKSLPASEAYDKTAQVVDAEGKAAPPLWICGHFVAKALCVLLRDQAKNKDAHYLLWQTKSAIQPRGPIDEFKAMASMPGPVLSWAKEGKAYSSLRPGSFDIEKSANTYRDRMSLVNANQQEM